MDPRTWAQINALFHQLVDLTPTVRISVKTATEFGESGHLWNRQTPDRVLYLRWPV